jgi:hypothetical protein
MPDLPAHHACRDGKFQHCPTASDATALCGDQSMFTPEAAVAAWLSITSPKNHMRVLAAALLREYRRPTKW